MDTFIFQGTGLFSTLLNDTTEAEPLQLRVVEPIDAL